MRWDSKRVVPWKRLLIEWVIVAAAIILITVVFSQGSLRDAVAASVLGGAIYLGFGFLLAKIGYARKTLKQIRAATAAAQAQQLAAAQSGPAHRARPAPTKRTSTGPSQHPRKKKR